MSVRARAPYDPRIRNVRRASRVMSTRPVTPAGAAA
jgi:hypothetical protein